MDERPLPAMPAHPPAPTPIPANDHEETRALLRTLDRELSRPVIEMREELGRVLADPAEGSARPTRPEAVGSMIDLCDDLLAMTRGYIARADLVLDDGTAQKSAPRPGDLPGAIDG